MCRRVATLLLEISSTNSLRTRNRDAWYQCLLTPYVASMVCRALQMFKIWARSKKLLLASSVDLKELQFFYRMEHVSENHSDYFWIKVTRSIYRVTSCEFMEWRKCKRSLFSKYVSNLVGCKVAYQDI